MLIADFGRAEPGLGFGASADDAVREIAGLCRARDLALCVDLVLDRVAIDGAAGMRELDGMFQARHQSDIVDPRLDPSIARSAVIRPGSVDDLAGWWSERLVRLVEAGATTFPPARPRAAAGRCAGDHTRGRAQACGRQVPRLDARTSLGRASRAGGRRRRCRLPRRRRGTVPPIGTSRSSNSLSRVARVLGTVQRSASDASIDTAARRRTLRLAAGTTDGLFLCEGVEDGLEPDLRSAIRLLRDAGPERRMKAVRRAHRRGLPGHGAGATRCGRSPQRAARPRHAGQQ